MVLYRRFLFILTVCVLVAASCTKPVLIGSDFLEDEKASLKVEDNFELSFFTEKTDSVIVHSKNVSRQLFRYLVGNIDEPVFGKYSAEIYAQPVLPGTTALELFNSSFDSVVLLLRYDTLGSYGEMNEPVTLEVYRMEENPSFIQNYYSNQRFSSPDLLGSVTFIPHPKDSVTVKDTVRLAPHVRIPLSVTKMSELLSQDSSVFTNQDSFLHFFNGLHIKMTSGSQTMLGFNLLNSLSGMSFFYDRGSSMDKEFRFVFTAGSIKTVYMEHDYSGSLAEASLSPEPEMDLWFVQGLSGLTTRMRIENLNILGDAIINQAELDVYCSFPDGDEPDLYPPIKYLVTQELTDTSIVNSIDANMAFSRATSNLSSSLYKTLYGGVLEQVSPGPPAVYRYTMKVTAQVKDSFQGKKENSIYFNPFDKANVPNRSVMFGPSHPDYAPRLRIYYTAL